MSVISCGIIMRYTDVGLCECKGMLFRRHLDYVIGGVLRNVIKES